MGETFASCFASVSLHDESTSPVIGKPIELKKKARKTLSWESSVMAYSNVKRKSFGRLYTICCNICLVLVIFDNLTESSLEVARYLVKEC